MNDPHRLLREYLLPNVSIAGHLVQSPRRVGEPAIDIADGYVFPSPSGPGKLCSS